MQKNKMSHAFNKSDGTFPHKKNGGVMGFPNKQAKGKGKVLEIVLGKAKKDNFGYRVEDHKGKILKEVGKKF